MQGRIDEQTGIRFLQVRNDSGEEIPACAAVRIMGVDSDGFYMVRKPNATGQTTGIAFNGPTAIPTTMTDDRGQQVFGKGTVFFEFPTLALCDPNESAPEAEDEWGTVNGEWFLRPGGGFPVIGNRLTTTAGHYADVIVNDVENPVISYTIAENLGNIGASEGYEVSDTNILSIPDAGEYLVSGVVQITLGDLSAIADTKMKIWIQLNGTFITVTPSVVSQELSILNGSYDSQVFTVPVAHHLTVTQADNLGIIVHNGTNELGTAIEFVGCYVNLKVVKLTGYSITAIRNITTGTTPVAGTSTPGLLYTDGATLQSVNGARVTDGFIEMEAGSDSWIRIAEASF